MPRFATDLPNPGVKSKGYSVLTGPVYVLGFVFNFMMVLVGLVTGDFFLGNFILTGATLPIAANYIIKVQKNKSALAAVEKEKALEEAKTIYHCLRYEDVTLNEKFWKNGLIDDDVMAETLCEDYQSCKLCSPISGVITEKERQAKRKETIAKRDEDYAEKKKREEAVNRKLKNRARQKVYDGFGLFVCDWPAQVPLHAHYEISNGSNIYSPSKIVWTWNEYGKEKYYALNLAGIYTPTTGYGDMQEVHVDEQTEPVATYKESSKRRACSACGIWYNTSTNAYLCRVCEEFEEGKAQTAEEGRIPINVEVKDEDGNLTRTFKTLLDGTWRALNDPETKEHLGYFRSKDGRLQIQGAKGGANE